MKSEELVELGFPRQMVTKVRKQLREEKAAPQSRTQKGIAEVASPVEATAVQARMRVLEGNVRQLYSRVEVLEAISA